MSSSKSTTKRKCNSAAALVSACAFILANSVSANSVSAQWDAPPGYYASAIGNGPVLKNQLTAIMSVGHIQRTYGDFRFSTAIHDRDPSDPSNILLVYNGVSVNGPWDNGQTWNREHVWPQARQPGTASNASQGNLGDPHALRPANPDVNELRENKPFGFSNTTGPFANLGQYFFPGDACKGDIARSLFYSDTRWTTLGLTLTDSFPNGNQMGNLSSLIAWHYLDPPDEFEQRRNHTIYSSDFNPQYYTNNRNAFIDRPEFVWSIHVDQQNDSSIRIAGGTLDANGQSMLTVDYGRLIVGAQVSTNQPVTLLKNGQDGTYYAVQVFENAVSDVSGFFNAFRTGAADSRSLNLSLQFDPNQPGVTSGLVVIDNLDVTTQGGSGQGGNDADDFIIQQLTVLDHANASFAAGLDQNTMDLDLGEIVLAEPISPVTVRIHNLASDSGADLTAHLDLLAVSTNPAASVLEIEGPLFEDLPAGQDASLTLSGVPDSLGPFFTQFVFQLSDEEVPGAIGQMLQLNLSFTVVQPFVPGDVNRDGVVSLLDIAPFIELLSSGSFQVEADINGDGVVSLLDIEPFVALVTGG